MSNEEPDGYEDIIVAAATSYLDEARAVSWERVKSETERDKEFISLIELARNGFPSRYKDMPENLAQFWSCREKLHVIDGVLMMGARSVIPKVLRAESLENLHSAHQGCARMRSRADTCIFWPGITADIEKKRAMCATCDVNTPSQQALPAATPALPTGPFQAVASDYFSLKGREYLVTVDRFSN